MSKKPWRADSWEVRDIAQKAVDKWCDNPTEETAIHVSHELVEAGADAMLGTLRKDGFHITVGMTFEIEGKKITATKNQTLVLIPDD